MTRKKYEFDWGTEQAQAFEAAKAAIQAALDLWPIKEGPLELMVTVDSDYVNRSLWQKQDSKRVPLGFWAWKLPEAGQNYTPFEQQLLAAYWALTETDQLTLNHEVALRPRIPIMQWIMSDPVSHKIGHAQEASIIKWKLYIQNRAKTGPAGVLALHEQVIEAPIQDDFQPIIIERVNSPVVYNYGYNSLSAEQKRHAWFTDGSARYIRNTRYWKAVAYNPVTKMVLKSSGEGKNSQFAELQAAYQAMNYER